MKEKDMRFLDDETLREISLLKNNKGVATKTAYIAQKILWERFGQPFSSSAHFKRDMELVKKF